MTRPLSIRSVVTVLAVVWLTGCASQTIRLTDADRAQVRSAARITVVHYGSPMLQITTPSDAVATAGKTYYAGESAKYYAPSGGSGSGNQGAAYASNLQVRYDLPKLMEPFSRRLLQGLQQQAGLSNLYFRRELLLRGFRPDGFQVSERDLAEGYRKQFDSQWVLELTLPRWVMYYRPIDWGSYEMGLAGKARLIRTRDAAVVWQGVCSAGSDKDFRIKEMNAQEGARLRQATVVAAQRCADQLVAQFLERP